MAATTETGTSTSGLGGLIAAVGLVTLVAGGVGFLGGHQLRRGMTAPPATAGQFSPAKVLQQPSMQFATLPPIITNLGGDITAWLRLEASVVIEGDKPVTGQLTAQLAEDATALLRTLSLQQIAGASGFQHLREELKERMRLRSAGRVKDVVIQSLVIE